MAIQHFMMIQTQTHTHTPECIEPRLNNNNQSEMKNLPGSFEPNQYQYMKIHTTGIWEQKFNNNNNNKYTIMSNLSSNGHKS